MKYYLDTNIIIYALNGKYPGVITHFQKVPSMSVVIPAIVVAEIEYGAKKSNDYGKTIAIYRDFINRLSVEPFSKNAAKCYGSIRAALEKKGQPIGANDMLIAATAMASNGTIVTHNTREFTKIEGLLLEDWTE